MSCCSNLIMPLDISKCVPMRERVINARMEIRPEYRHILVKLAKQYDIINIYTIGQQSHGDIIVCGDNKFKVEYINKETSQLFEWEFEM